MTTAPKVNKTDAEWRKELTPEQYRITREHGTERPFSHPYNNEKPAGMYICVSCGAPLFRSETKYDSGSGWPSFYKPVEAGRGRRAARRHAHDAPHRNALCANAKPILAMFSMMGPIRPACATA